MADPPKRTGDEVAAHLLPGWSSLVILLTLFAVISGVSLLVILRGEEAHVTPESGGTRAFGPADFPEIEFDAPLLAAVAEAGAGADRAGGIIVPPPPFSDESVFPCSDCHEDMETDPEPRELGFHEEIQLKHGPDDRWCFDCHNAGNRDHLRLANGSLLGFDESYRLCGQCHGTIFRDWREGIHGRRRGYWNGAKSYMLCAHCHNPHEPAFKPIEPLPPPVRPAFLDGRGPGAVAASTGGDHEP